MQRLSAPMVPFKGGASVWSGLQCSSSEYISSPQGALGAQTVTETKFKPRLQLQRRHSLSYSPSPLQRFQQVGSQGQRLVSALNDWKSQGSIRFTLILLWKFPTPVLLAFFGLIFCLFSKILLTVITAKLSEMPFRPPLLISTLCIIAIAHHWRDLS